MLPLYEDLLELENDFAEDFEIEKEPSKTFKIDWENSEVVGYVDGLEAIRQAIYLMKQKDLRMIYIAGITGLRKVSLQVLRMSL